MTQPNLGDRVRLASDPKGLVFTVSSVYLEGSEQWVSLRIAGADLKAPRIHRPVVDLVTEGGA